MTKSKFGKNRTMYKKRRALKNKSFKKKIMKGGGVEQIIDTILTDKDAGNSLVKPAAAAAGVLAAQMVAPKVAEGVWNILSAFPEIIGRNFGSLLGATTQNNIGVAVFTFAVVAMGFLWYSSGKNENDESKGDESKGDESKRHSDKSEDAFDEISRIDEISRMFALTHAATTQTNALTHAATTQTNQILADSLKTVLDNQNQANIIALEMARLDHAYEESRLEKQAEANQSTNNLLVLAILANSGTKSGELTALINSFSKKKNSSEKRKLPKENAAQQKTSLLQSVWEDKDEEEEEDDDNDKDEDNDDEDNDIEGGSGLVKSRKIKSRKIKSRKIKSRRVVHFGGEDKKITIDMVLENVLDVLHKIYDSLDLKQKQNQNLIISKCEQLYANREEMVFKKENDKKILILGCLLFLLKTVFENANTLYIETVFVSPTQQKLIIIIKKYLKIDQMEMNKKEKYLLIHTDLPKTFDSTTLNQELSNETMNKIKDFVLSDGAELKFPGEDFSSFFKDPLILKKTEINSVEINDKMDGDIIDASSQIIIINKTETPIQFDSKDNIEIFDRIQKYIKTSK